MHAAAAQDTLALALASSRLITITKCECVEYYVPYAAHLTLRFALHLNDDCDDDDDASVA